MDLSAGVSEGELRGGIKEYLSAIAREQLDSLTVIL
jgi:hypothetical protein